MKYFSIICVSCGKIADQVNKETLQCSNCYQAEDTSSYVCDECCQNMLEKFQLTSNICYPDIAYCLLCKSTVTISKGVPHEHCHYR